MLKKINFDIIIKSFDSEEWNIGFLNKQDLNFLENAPIKFDPNSHYPHSFGLLFSKHTCGYDYSMPKNILNIIENNIPDLKFNFCFNTNLKNAAILAGIGQYGKNQLVYDYKFGFDCHFCLLLVENEIINLPKKEITWDFLSCCDNCEDCFKACPVEAIHNDVKPFWVDKRKCDNFCHWGNNKIIPSMKWVWGKYIEKPSIDKDILFKIESFEDAKNILNKDDPIKCFTFINNEQYFIQYPVCRECCSQVKCSKYKGKYPYDFEKFLLV